MIALRMIGDNLREGVFSGLPHCTNDLFNVGPIRERPDDFVAIYQRLYLRIISCHEAIANLPEEFTE